MRAIGLDCRRLFIGSDAVAMQRNTQAQTKAGYGTNTPTISQHISVLHERNHPNKNIAL
jgi:hypothetical protein